MRKLPGQLEDLILIFLLVHNFANFHIYILNLFV